MLLLPCRTVVEFKALSLNKAIKFTVKGTVHPRNFMGFEAIWQVDQLWKLSLYKLEHTNVLELDEATNK